MYMQQQPQAFGFAQPAKIAIPANQGYAQPSPTMNSAYLMNSPSIVMGPSSTNNVSPPGFGLATPPPQLFPQLICSPGPVPQMNLQQAWTIPQWQPMYIPQAVPMQAMPFPVFPQTPTQGPMDLQQSEIPQQQIAKRSSPIPERKSRMRCKCCSAGCRNTSIKDVDPVLLNEVMKDRNDLMEQLPEFFGEPLLNFDEFVFYCPIFRAEAVGEMEYYKIPRTTKERELNIPRRLTELFVRTFGPEDAPTSKTFKRTSPHTELCEVRMAVRNSIVKSLPDVITGCRNIDEANGIFDLIFRFTGVAMAKSVTANLPQCFIAVVKMEGDVDSECTGVVSLFNYHLFRRKITKAVC